MRIYKTEGIVIKRKNFKEADRILTIFTCHNGKIQAKAPGVRRITSRRSSHIELLNISAFTLYQSQKSLYPIITEAQILEDFSSIKKDLKKIGLSYYICELVDRLCPQNQENRKVFFLVKDALFRLENYIYSSSESQALLGESKEVLLKNSSQPQSNVASQAQTITLSSIIDNFEDELLVLLGFLPKLNKLKNKPLFIEDILEGKLFTKRLLPLFLQIT